MLQTAHGFEIVAIWGAPGAGASQRVYFTPLKVNTPLIDRLGYLSSYELPATPAHNLGTPPPNIYLITQVPTTNRTHPSFVGLTHRL